VSEVLQLCDAKLNLKLTRLRYLVDLTPLMALAIISNAPYVHIPELRPFLSRYIGFEPYMNVGHVSSRGSFSLSR
jgi:hypothetical protein